MRPVPERLYCSVPSHDEHGELIGTCGSFVPGRTADECAQRAAAWGWQVQPQALCPSHRAMAGKPRLVVDLSLPARDPDYRPRLPQRSLQELAEQLGPIGAALPLSPVLARLVIEAELRGGG